MSETVEKEDDTDPKESSKIMNEENCNECGKACDPYEKPSLRCSGGCDRRIHVECMKRGCVPTTFVGDIFFELSCASCNPLGEDMVIRDRMPWLNVIVLALYNLREKSNGISKRGYFHWRSDITTFVDKNWDSLFKKTVKRKKNWIGTISGTLSHYTGIFFKSGTNELGESGWWKLLDNDPPEVLIAKNSKTVIRRKKHSVTKSPYKSFGSPAPSDSSISLGEDSNCGGELVKSLSLSIYSQEYIRPTEVLSDFLFEEDELNEVDNKDNMVLRDSNYVPSISDLIRECQYENANFPTNDCDWLRNTSNSPSSNYISNQIEKAKEEPYDEDSDEGSNEDSSAQEQLPVSLFKETVCRPWPWLRALAASDAKMPRMTRQEETYLLQRVNKTNLDTAPSAVRRLYRKLAVRRAKREYRLPLLDIDSLGSKSEFKSARSSRDRDRMLDRFSGNDLEGIFEQRLQGYNEPVSVHSPYTNRLLKPFIRRDTCCKPLWLRVTEELCLKANKNNPEWKPSPRAPIDYSYVRPQHVPAINSLCSQFFWSGIDLTECLQYPDFTCVVLYKKLVIGFAVLIPNVGYNEAYISFILTRPEWRHAGIGTFMLYHLIQTCMGRDITLHVSATNPALILYQRFGFKVEEFVQDFYDKYTPPNSRECRHALYLRLSR